MRVRRAANADFDPPGSNDVADPAVSSADLSMAAALEGDHLGLPIEGFDREVLSTGSLPMVDIAALGGGSDRVRSSPED